MKLQQKNQKGFSHIVPIITIVVLLSLLSFVGYNSFVKKSLSEAGGRNTAGKNSVKKQDAALPIRVAQYNILHAVNHSPGCKDSLDAAALKCVSYRGKQQVAVINGSKTGNIPLDIITLTEVSRPQLAFLKQQLPGYRSYPNEAPSSQGKAILWNTKRFTLQSTSEVPSIYNNIGKSSTAPSVNLVSKENNQKVSVMAVHSPHSGYAGPSVRLHNANRIAAWTKSTINARPNTLVVVGGDFNDGADRTSSNRLYCVLSKQNLRAVHDIEANRQGGCSGGQPSIPIDQIYVSRNVKTTSRNLKYYPSGIGTDHSPLISVLDVSK
jgi:endonuclease/exonuclease/phosphatase family metal-dependent hydrolase